VEDIVELGMPQMIIWHMCIACWMLKPSNTHSQYLTPIALPLQQWLHERAWMLRCAYIACLVWAAFRHAHVSTCRNYSPAQSTAHDRKNRRVILKRTTFITLVTSESFPCW